MMVLSLRVPDEVLCRSCGNVFCCANCRIKHEQNTHSTVIHQSIKASSICDQHSNRSKQLQKIYLFCAICEQRPLRLVNNMHLHLMQHIAETHMPLQCQKCYKFYETMDDLKNFNKCYHNPTSSTYNSPQYISKNDASKINVMKTGTQTISTQTSPWTKNENGETPLSHADVHWKYKSRETHASNGDSVSSLRNISIMSNSSIKRSNSHSHTQSHSISSRVMGKVIRSTSTPVQLSMIVAKPNMPSFDASGNCQVSSIHNSGCDTEEGQALLHSAAITNNNKALETVTEGRKIVIGRTKMQPITPLRRVMSKSIQKALVQNGMVTASFLVPYNCRNNSDSIISPDLEGNNAHAEALDLRLSPALRRSKSDGGSETTTRKSIYTPYNTERKILMSAHKFTTTESIVISRTEKMSRPVIKSESSYITNQSFLTNSNYQSTAPSNTDGSIYKTCSNVKIIRTTTELSEVNIQQDQSENDVRIVNKNSFEKIIPSNMLLSTTPIARISGAAVNKKFIKFETPKPEKTSAEKLIKILNSPEEVFYTPKTSPEREDIDEKLPALSKPVSRNLVKHFSIDNKSPLIKQCAQGATLSRNMDYTCDLVDEVYYEDNKYEHLQNISNANGQQLFQQNDQFGEQQRKFQFQEHKVGIWSKMTSIFRLPALNDTMQKISNGSSELNSRYSTSIIKRCASIAGSLVRVKAADRDGQLQNFKRKRTHTADNQYTSTFLTELNSFGGASPPLDATSKRLRIHGRRPIRQTSINHNKKN